MPCKVQIGKEVQSPDYRVALRHRAGYLGRSGPIFGGHLAFNTAGPFLIIGGTVIALHLISANLLIPKCISSRVNIGPFGATLGMLFWSWIWGAVGLMLAVPLTAFVKLVADCNPSLIHISNLLAETPRPLPRRAITSGVTLRRAIPFLRARFGRKGKAVRFSFLLVNCAHRF